MALWTARRTSMPWAAAGLLALVVLLVGSPHALSAQVQARAPDLAELMTRPAASYAERKQLVADCLRAGAAFEELGRQRSALLVYGHALKIWPNHPEALASYQRLRGQNELKEQNAEAERRRQEQLRREAEARANRERLARERAERQRAARERARRERLSDAARLRAEREAKLRAEREAKLRAEAEAAARAAREAEIAAQQEKERLAAEAARREREAMLSWTPSTALILTLAAGTAALALIAFAILLGYLLGRRREPELAPTTILPPPAAQRHPLNELLDLQSQDLVLRDSIPELDLRTRMQVLDRLETQLHSSTHSSAAFMELLTPLLADPSQMARVRAQALLEQAVRNGAESSPEINEHARALSH